MQTTHHPAAGRSITLIALILGLTVAFAGCSSDGGAGGDATSGDGSVTDGGGADGGGSDAGFPADRALFINEVVAKAVATGENPTASDWVELYNKSSKKVDLAGWRIIDSKSKPFAEAIPFPKGVTIPARGYLVVFFNKDGAGSPTIPKGLRATEALSLFSPDGVLQDRIDWKIGDAPSGKSWGRTPDGGDVMQTFDKPSPNASNP